MCNPVPACGTRCTQCTAPAYRTLIDAMDAAGTAGTKKNPFGKGMKERKQVRDTFTAQTVVEVENATNIAANYASTKAGAKKVAADIDRYTAAGDRPTATWLTSCLRFGTDRAEERATTKTAIKKAAESEARKATGSTRALRVSKNAVPGWNMAEIYPTVAEWWDYDLNDGILPTQVTPNVNEHVFQNCAAGHSFAKRGNNLIVPIKKANALHEAAVAAAALAGISAPDAPVTYPECPHCHGRRPKMFKQAQTDLAPIADAMGGNAAAFDSLPPAIQYDLLRHLGLLGANDKSMARQVGMSMVNGNLTLTDVLAAADNSVVDANIDETLTDNGRLHAVRDFGPTASESNTTSGIDIDQVLSAAGVLALVPTDSDLAESIAHTNNELLWAAAYDTENDLNGYVQFLTARRGQSTFGDSALDRFLSELAIVRNFTLPTGYTAEQTDKFGQPVTKNPDLCQRRFALLVSDRRRFLNFSTMGAGKTLAGVLAAQTNGARETVVVCPVPAKDEWKNEFTSAFPAHTEVINGLPDPERPLPSPAPGINRVWVTNYEAFQTRTGVTLAHIDAATRPLAERVDAIIFDEVHRAKTSSETSASSRHTALLKFADTAREANENLIVLGISATPVVNNLVEAKSILRLVEGPTSQTFGVTPTIRNATNAHHRLAASGLRRKMKYPVNLTRTDVVIDVSDQLSAIHANVTAKRRSKGATTMHASYIEAALLAAKIPHLVAIAQRRKTNNEGPTVVYTEYVDDMIAPMEAALTDAGLRVATYLGRDNDSTRAQTLREFRDGAYDVLIGSEVIGTGVDGLQHVSNEMVVVSMPWTAAADDQLVGRLNRRGQTKNITITYLLTEAWVEDLYWSWCKDNRQQRVRFKRDIANAAVDGVLPASLATETNYAQRSLDTLADMTNRQHPQAA